MVWPLGISVLGALTAIFRPNAAVVALGGVAVWMIVTPVVAQLMLRKHVPPMLRPAGFIRQAKHFGMLTRLVVSLYVGVIWLAVLSAVALLGTLLVGGLRTLI